MLLFLMWVHQDLIVEAGKENCSGSRPWYDTHMHDPFQYAMLLNLRPLKVERDVAILADDRQSTSHPDIKFE